MKNGWLSAGRELVDDRVLVGLSGLQRELEAFGDPALHPARARQSTESLEGEERGERGGLHAGFSALADLRDHASSSSSYYIRVERGVAFVHYYDRYRQTERGGYHRNHTPLNTCLLLPTAALTRVAKRVTAGMAWPCRGMDVFYREGGWYNTGCCLHINASRSSIAHYCANFFFYTLLGTKPFTNIHL